MDNIKTSQIIRAKNLKSKKRTCSNIYRIPKIYGISKLKEPEPLVDILQEKDEVIIVAGIAGFNKESLKINIKNNRLTLSAETSERKYNKSLNLPMGVIPDNIRTEYKNGVLEIRLKKVVEEKALDKVSG